MNGRPSPPSHPQSQVKTTDVTCLVHSFAFTVSCLGQVNVSARVLWGQEELTETYLSNTALVAKTFLGVLIQESLQLHVCLPKCQHWNFFPSTPTKLMQWKLLNSCWFQIAALRNLYPLLALHSKPCVGPGCLG